MTTNNAHSDLDDFPQVTSDGFGENFDICEDGQRLSNDISGLSDCAGMRSQRKVPRDIQVISRDNGL